MELEDKFSLISSIDTNSKPYLLERINEDLEPEIYEAIKKLCDKIKKLIINPEEFRRIIHIVVYLHGLESFHNLINHPISINLFKDKNGNQYLQARTSITENKKQVWINAYVGKLSEFPKGKDDQKAMEKGRVLLRKKLFEKYFSKF